MSTHVPTPADLYRRGQEQERDELLERAVRALATAWGVDEQTARLRLTGVAGP